MTPIYQVQHILPEPWWECLFLSQRRKALSFILLILDIRVGSHLLRDSSPVSVAAKVGGL